MRNHSFENGPVLSSQEFATNFYVRFAVGKREIVKASGETTEFARFEITVPKS
jgi:hypothetical protein